MQRRAVLVFLLSLVAGVSCIHKAMAQGGVQPAEPQQVDQPREPQQIAPTADPRRAAPVTLTSICPHTDLFSEIKTVNDPNSQSPVRQQFSKPWQKEFPLLVLNLMTKSLYWTQRYSDPLVQISYQGVAPRVATTENVIVLICNARQGDGSTVNATPVVVNGPDANDGLFALDGGAPAGQIDRMFLLDGAKGNDIMRVDFVGPTITKGLVAKNFQDEQYKSQLAQDQVAIEKDQANLAADQAAINPQEQDHAKAGAAQAKVTIDRATLEADLAKRHADAAASRTTDKVTDTIATVFVERHKVIHFSAGGGLLFTVGRSRSYSVLTVPTTVTTTTTISSTTVSTGTTTIIGSNSQTTPAVTNGTANFAFSTLIDRPQVNGIAGLTWYLFGHDTFPVSEEQGYAVTYASHSLKESLGLFFGTSVSSLGNFTVAPAIELRPGIQVFAGPSWYSRPYLPSNITACAGYGTSTPYAGPMTTATQTQSVPGPPATTTTTTTTVTVSTTNGCANGDAATMLSGSNLPTQSHYVTAFAFGLVFNTNLFKAFSGIK
jgi:hypothetical protein